VLLAHDSRPLDDVCILDIVAHDFRRVVLTCDFIIVQQLRPLLLQYSAFMLCFDRHILEDTYGTCVRLTRPTNMSSVNQEEEEVLNMRRKAAAVVTIVFALLLFLPLGILGAALDWPNNLSEDASHNLPLLLEEETSTFWGYFIYLWYSILFFPMGWLFATTVAGPTLADSPLVGVSTGFAALSAVTRSIGLSRWLFAMPILARMYVDPNTSTTTKEAISVSYEMLNGWGGGIGEILGVSMFAALWVVCTSILFIKSPEWPSWMGWVGFLVAADLALNLLEMAILEIDMGVNLPLAVVLLHAWLLVAAFIFLRTPCCKKCVPVKQAAPDDHAGDAVMDQPQEKA
jgi:hypothetical protein